MTSSLPVLSEEVVLELPEDVEEADVEELVLPADALPHAVRRLRSRPPHHLPEFLS
ncbi:MAG: hypothetical protein LUG61_08985 [Lachnospiraceae bacterium]|nr:hypothetical protein [Lachnospiraceae bacterium]